MKINRRNWLVGSAAVTGSALAARFQQPKYYRDLRPKHSRVTILHADRYSNHLDELVFKGMQLFNLNIRGKSVLLKPNIVEYNPGRPVNTNPQLIGAAAEAFLRLGAASVIVAEGPGHHREASSHAVLPVNFRLKVPERLPETNMKQAHRFQPFLRSSNSPERESSGRFASHFP